MLLVSAELDEILALSDRIAVMYKGRIVDIVDTHATNREQLGLMMAGVHVEAGGQESGAGSREPGDEEVEVEVPGG